MREITKNLRRTIVLLMMAMVSTALVQRAFAQDQPDQDDPPSRVARLGFMEGSISFQPAGESEWVEAVRNRPMTTGDKVWADKGSRAELELGSAVIDLNSNTGISFLNLDDRTTQIQLSSGAVSVRVRHLDRDDVFEIDTPNQAFSIFQPGQYRVEASEDGSYTVVSVSQGEGESTGNGQTYTVHAGQRATFEGTDTLRAQVEDLRGSDDFDNWIDARNRRYENSPSARYVSHDMVGYADLDQNGDWSPDPGYGNVWYPHVKPDGHPIVRATGPGSILGDGPGSMTNPGATRHFTMAGGSRSAVVGDGFRGRRKCGRCMRPPWWSSSAELPADSVATWAGSRWVREKFMCRRIR